MTALPKRQDETVEDLAHDERPQPLLWTIDQTAHALNMSRSRFYEAFSSGIIGPVGVKIGPRRYFRPDEVRQWVAAGCPGRQKWIQQKK